MSQAESAAVTAGLSESQALQLSSEALKLVEERSLVAVASWWGLGTGTGGLDVLVRNRN